MLFFSLCLQLGEEPRERSWLARRFAALCGFVTHSLVLSLMDMCGSLPSRAAEPARERLWKNKCVCVLHMKPSKGVARRAPMEEPPAAARAAAAEASLVPASRPPARMGVAPARTGVRAPGVQMRVLCSMGVERARCFRSASLARSSVSRLGSF